MREKDFGIWQEVTWAGYWQHVELVEQCGVELASALIGGKRLMPIGRRIERVPPDQHGAGLLRLVEAQQEVGEADDGTAELAARPQDRFRQAVIGAVGE